MNMLPTIDQINVRGKRVLVRVDFNVPLNNNGEIVSDLRIKQALPTINYLLNKGAKVVLLSHRSEEPEKKKRMGEKDSLWKKWFSLNGRNGSLVVVKERLSSLLGKQVGFVEDCIGEKVKKEIKQMQEGEILLLENVRIYREEKEGSEEFAKELASLADTYINDAFSVSHRPHTSVALLPGFLESAAGMMMEKEIKVLSKIQKNPDRPLVVVIGGAKIESKIRVLNYFLENADHVLLGGKIANTILIVKKIALNSPWPDDNVVSAVEEMELTSPKVHLPVDALATSDKTGKSYIRETAPGGVRREEDIFDIGRETIKIYKEIIKEAGTIIWAGPLGYFEQPGFERGTYEIAEQIARNYSALKVVGGGDTSNALMSQRLLDKVDHVSCGGGALLTYLSKGPMPGIESLRL